MEEKDKQRDQIGERSEHCGGLVTLSPPQITSRFASLYDFFSFFLQYAEPGPAQAISVTERSSTARTDVESGSSSDRSRRHCRSVVDMHEKLHPAL